MCNTLSSGKGEFSGSEVGGWGPLPRGSATGLRGQGESGLKGVALSRCCGVTGVGEKVVQKPENFRGQVVYNCVMPTKHGHRVAAPWPQKLHATNGFRPLRASDAALHVLEQVKGVRLSRVPGCDEPGDQVGSGLHG